MAGPLPQQHAQILAQKLADGQLALFVGAGLSRQAVSRNGSGRKLPLWKPLAEQVAAACHEDLSTYGGNVLDLFDAIAFGQSRFELEEAVRRVLDDNGFEPSEAHHALAKLPWAGIYTTNYDGLLGRVLNESPVAEEDHYDRLQRAEGQRPRLFHVHGTLEKPHTLTRDDYRLWPEKHPRAYRDLEAVVLDKTVLFVGYSLSDPHLADGLLPMVRKITAGREKRLYAWMWQVPPNQVQLLDRRDKISAIPLNHDGDYLAALTQIEVILARPSSDAVHTPRRDKTAIRVFLSYSRLDRDRVYPFYYLLRQNGFIPWMDEKDLLPGQEWQEEIAKAVKTSDIFVAFLSKRAISRDGYLQKEIRFALDRADEIAPGNVYLIPARLEDCEIPDRLKKYQWADLFTRTGPVQLMRSLEARSNLISPWQETHIAKHETDIAKKEKRQLPEVWPAMLVRLTDSDASVRLAATDALKTVVSEPAVRGALLGRLADSDNRVRSAAVRALAGMVDDADVCAALLTRLEDSDGVVRESAIQALEGALRQGEVKKSISSGLASDEAARAVALGLLAAAVSGRSDRFGADPSSLLDLAIFKDKDAPWCPEMVVIPSGSFLMGSPEGEEGRTETEGPQHQVTIAYRFAIGRYAVTVGEYGQFIKETGRYASGGMRVRTGNEWKYDPSKSWRDPGFPQTERHPVVGVSWDLASKYCEWLSQKTGQPYRLPSEAEWEYACRAGTITPFSFGRTITHDQVNYSGKQYGTVETGALPANPWGLHEMHGNVSEWVEDVIHGSYKDAPIDGYAWTEDNEQVQQRVHRGGAWIANRKDCRSARRFSNVTEKRVDFIGFRVARSL